MPAPTRSARRRGLTAFTVAAVGTLTLPIVRSLTGSTAAAPTSATSILASAWFAQQTSVCWLCKVIIYNFRIRGSAGPLSNPLSQKNTIGRQGSGRQPATGLSNRKSPRARADFFCPKNRRSSPRSDGFLGLRAFRAFCVNSRSHYNSHSCQNHKRAKYLARRNVQQRSVLANRGCGVA